MRKEIQRRWTIVAFKHPDHEHSVFYRKGIKNLENAVTQAIEKGANLMSIRGFDITIEEYDIFKKIEKDQQLLEIGAIRR